MIRRKTIGTYTEALKALGLLAEAQEKKLESLCAETVDSVACDTRELDGSSALFICKGAHFKSEYILQAAEKGALAYISETDYNSSIPAIIVTDVRAAMSCVAKVHAGGADSILKKIGITGTKGKSTVAYFVRSVLNEFMSDRHRPECAVLSSIEDYDGVVRNESHLTTPEPVELFRHFENAVDSGITHLVMEASSQGLKYGRLSGVRFDVGAFLNIGEDHISPIEHPDFNDYFKSKLKIFDISEKAVVFSDIPQYDAIREYATGKTVLFTYGMREDADFRLSDIEKQGHSYCFTVTYQGKPSQYRITVPGRFNVDNATAAIAICTLAGVDDKYIRKGLVSARASGRMEVFYSADGKIEAIVDYAHNRLSFETLFGSIEKEHTGRYITAVYGCPGMKAQQRRQDLPEVSEKYCKRIFITEEDSGEESFESISSDLRSNFSAGTDVRIIENREEAISDAILSSPENGIVVITGKGRETRQKRGLSYEPCVSDVECVKRTLSVYNSRIDIAKMLPGFEKYKGKRILIGLYSIKYLPEEEFTSIIDAIVLYHAAGAVLTVFTDAPSRLADALTGEHIEITEKGDEKSGNFHNAVFVGDMNIRNFFRVLYNMRADKVILMRAAGGLCLGKDRSETAVSSLTADEIEFYVSNNILTARESEIASGALKMIRSGTGKVSVIAPSKNSLIYDALLPIPDGTVISAEDTCVKGEIL